MGRGVPTPKAPPPPTYYATGQVVLMRLYFAKETIYEIVFPKPRPEISSSNQCVYSGCMVILLLESSQLVLIPYSLNGSAMYLICPI